MTNDIQTTSKFNNIDDFWSIPLPTYQLIKHFSPAEVMQCISYVKNSFGNIYTRLSVWPPSKTFNHSSNSPPYRPKFGKNIVVSHSNTIYHKLLTEYDFQVYFLSFVLFIHLHTFNSLEIGP